MKIKICILIILITITTNAFGRVLTKEEIANMVLNSYRYKKNTVPTETIINNVTTRMETTFKDWSNLMETYEGQYIISTSDGDNIDFFYITGSQANFNNHPPYMNNTSATINTSYLTGHKIRYKVSNDTINTNFPNTYTTNFTTYCYTDINIKTNSSNSNANGTNQYLVGYYNPTTLFDENYISSTQWQVTPAINNTMQIPNNENTFYQIPYSSFTNYLGSLTDATYLGNMITEIYAYNGTDWEKVNQLNIYNNQIENLDVFGPLITDNNGIKTLLLRLNSRYITPNTYIVYYIEPTQEANEQYNLQGLREFFYITNNKTILSGDTLNIIATFSGDTNYIENVNNAIDNEQQNQNNINLDETNKGIQDINNTLEEAKEQNQNFFTFITNYMNDLFIVSGEQIEQLKDTLKEQLNDWRSRYRAIFGRI